MIAPVIFLGNETSAAGYRLAGAKVCIPRPGEELASLEQARGEAALVIVSAEVAARLPASALEPALAAAAPLLLVAAPLRGAEPDLAARLLAQLGIG